MKNTPREVAEKTALVTSTFYNPDSKIDRNRAEIATRTIKSAHDFGYKLVVIDGGSYDEFLRAIEGYGSLFQENPRGMGSGRRQGIREGLKFEVPVVAWTEVEKESYIREAWKTAVSILEDRADLVYPARPSLNDYPTSQQHAEKFGNSVLMHLTGARLDYWFGPKTWKRDISNYFLNYPPENRIFELGKRKINLEDKWDSLHLPVLDIIKAGKRVISIPVNYEHPKAQTADEETDVEMDLKRLEQLQNLVPASVAYWRKNS